MFFSFARAIQVDHVVPLKRIPQTLSTDGKLFTHLENLWKFEAGKPVPTGPTCIVNFLVSSLSYLLVCII